jgi:hypothetical protein
LRPPLFSETGSQCVLADVVMDGMWLRLRKASYRESRFSGVSSYFGPVAAIEVARQESRLY